MSTNRQTFSCTWTPTNAVQPTRQTPATLPNYVDTTATQVAEFELVLASGSALTLALPAGWTQATQALLINTDSTNYINLKLGSSSLDVTLAPNGGHFDFTAPSYSAVAVPGDGTTRLPAYGTWVVQGTNASGTSPGTTTGLYIWLAGF